MRPAISLSATYPYIAVFSMEGSSIILLLFNVDPLSEGVNQPACMFNMALSGLLSCGIIIIVRVVSNHVCNDNSDKSLHI